MLGSTTGAIRVRGRLGQWSPLPLERPLAGMGTEQREGRDGEPKLFALSLV